jgi:hypothetical protein
VTWEQLLNLKLKGKCEMAILTPQSYQAAINRDAAAAARNKVIRLGQVDPVVQEPPAPVVVSHGRPSAGVERSVAMSCLPRGRGGLTRLASDAQQPPGIERLGKRTE